MSMQGGSRAVPGGRAGWWGVGVVLVAAAGISAWAVNHRSGADVAPHVAAPQRTALVYATPLDGNPFAHRELVFRASATGTDAVRLGTGTNPVISPDGRWIAYTDGTVNRPRRLLVVGAAGGKPMVFPIATFDPVVWSPDSRLFAAATLDGVTVADIRSRGLSTINLPDSSRAFSFSPDGRQLAFVRSTGAGQDIYEVATTGGEPRRLTDDGRSGSPLWGPDAIAFARYTAGGHGDVWLMDPSGGNARQLTHTSAGISPAFWSADGSRMLAASPAMHNGKLYAVDVFTGDARALTGFVGDLYPQGLSRDGSTVLAAIGCGGMIGLTGTVETIPFNGGSPKVIVRGPCRASWNA